MRRFRILLLPLLLTGCFLVGSFGDYWKKGTVDPLLEGTWTDVSSRKSITLVKRGSAYGYGDIKDPTQLRTLKAGETTFLMIKGVTTQAILRYAATKDRVVIYAPNPLMRQDFLDNYVMGSGNFSVEQRGVRIHTLTDSTVKLLEVLAKDKGYWKEQMIFEKGTGLTDEVLEEEAQEAPDPFAEAREKYKDVIGKKKGGATKGVPEVIPSEEEAEDLEKFQKMLQEQIRKQQEIAPQETPAPSTPTVPPATNN